VVEGQTTTIEMPAGATGGHTLVVRPVETETPVEMVETSLTVNYELADGTPIGTVYLHKESEAGKDVVFVLGEDGFIIPTVNDVAYEVVEGQTTTIEMPAGATGGHTLVVRPVETETPVEMVETSLTVNYQLADGTSVGTVHLHK
ncbi:MAG: hypothetical protein Q4E86_11625, partial [Lachnospiraceae bacterium]|nr:hypothetical protein [Lachnospiraceae bacterium]